MCCRVPCSTLRWISLPLIECKHKTEKYYLLHATQYVFEGPLLRLVIVTDVLLAGSESKFKFAPKNSLLVIDLIATGFENKLQKPEDALQETGEMGTQG